MFLVPAIQRQACLAGLGVLGVVSLGAWMEGGWRPALLPGIGFVAGWALYRASFGFASVWRAFLTSGVTLGLRAQVVMIGLTGAIFFPLIAHGSLGGAPLTGFLNPVGLALCLGAFLFGIGMQIGGGCGSGTLYTAGGGNVRMVVTLAAFVAGSVLATTDPGGWSGWSSAGAYSIIDWLGAPAAVVAVLLGLGAVYGVLLVIETRRVGAVAPLWHGGLSFAMRTAWPLLSGALALAAVNVATLIVAGRPWGITSAFALWGAKIVSVAGVDAGAWPYWRDDPSLHTSLFADATSLMNVGLMAGAFTAAAAAGKFRPQWRIQAGPLAAAVAGGLLMGFGARLATGCNIGAFFSGLASGSLHGLVWLLFALPGCAVGIRLRPLFRL